MENCKEGYAEAPFKHIYIEDDIDVGNLKAVERFRDAGIIRIKHYKDLFNRQRQSFVGQKASPNLIIARKHGKLIYEGSPVCQDFGNKHFYYTSCVMNCLYDCEYCYLRGMYPSANPTIFVNLEDIFDELDGLLKKHPVYLCVSYDTDLMAFEDLTGYVEKWCDFTASREDLTIEIRTKCARKDLWDRLTSCERVIFAYTISPQEIITKYEKGTPSLLMRAEAASVAMEHFPVRLCFDPMIFIKDWKDIYGKMFDEITEIIDIDRIKDFSVGSFRISSGFLKNMRRMMPDSEIAQYPFELMDGFYQYPKELADGMENYMSGLIREKKVDSEIFRP
ncbi:MAG: radical SAM protein [Lachnospiraceae bacterium]|nr:radical SAM protein [Lachnospiraceae bacterium]